MNKPELEKKKEGNIYPSVAGAGGWRTARSHLTGESVSISPEKKKKPSSKGGVGTGALK